VCGLAALLHGSGVPDPGLIGLAVGSLRHRGPDAYSTRRVPGCDLGHTRLSIIDLQSGAQPMQSADRRLWIVFNGEIYNYRELRTELAGMGNRFLTESDTEVILSAYATWGAGCLDRLRGMYAFVIWDPQIGAAFAARDPFGEKPLYYARTSDNGVLFASEIKALEATRLVRRDLNLKAVDAYLALGYVPPDQSIWSAIDPLPPGHFLRWKSGHMETTRYWTPAFQGAQITFDDAVGRLSQFLEASVRRQLVADVPVGAFLSGGHDSSTIVALMSRAGAATVQTFSVGFGSEINELDYARLVARQYATEHHEVDLGAPDVAAMLERMVEVYDEPFADSSCIPTYMICEFARKYVKVVLAGDGGDELFGGYGWYNPLLMAEGVPRSHFRWLALRLVSKLLCDARAGLRWRSVALGLAARWPDTWTRAVMSQMYFRPSERLKLWAGRSSPASSFWPGPLYRPAADVRGINEAFHYDLTSYLPGDILVKVDRASMAHGLECRAPFLDRDLAEFALRLPASLKIDGEANKIVLREAAAPLWPAGIRTRGKQGFGAPHAAWLTVPGVRDLVAEVSRRGSRLRTLLPGLRDASLAAPTYKSWLLLALGLWLERRVVAV
jgi:asparagine synthase (glutamine-hydrolysing)